MVYFQYPITLLIKVTLALGLTDSGNQTGVKLLIMGSSLQTNKRFIELF